MKKRSLVSGMVLGILVVSLASPMAVSGFWPFDGLFGKGEVKGETTDSKRQSVFSRFLNRPTPSPVVIKEAPAEVEDEITEETLTKALKNKSISETQRREIQTRLRAIKAKREELKKMREAFVAWLKTNNIEPKAWGTEKNGVEEGRKDVQQKRVR